MCDARLDAVGNEPDVTRCFAVGRGMGGNEHWHPVVVVTAPAAGQVEGRRPAITAPVAIISSNTFR